MAIWAGLKSLKYKHLLRLSGVFISNPRYLLPTYKATKETIALCNKFFGRQHHGNNRTNAFRHALWNFNICQRCFKAAGSSEKTVAWAKTITDLHEDLMPNNELSKRMDLHNNELGRTLFRDYPGSSSEIISLLMEMMTNAKKVSNVRELKIIKNKLVYIES